MAAGVSAPGSPVPPPAHPTVAQLGRGVRFLGYDLSPPTVARGGSVEVVYHFESLERIADGWRPFFHLDGPAGYRNIDHVPVDGTYPLERWRPGQRIRDRQKITFPPDSPPGTYVILLGIYKGSERLSVSPSDATDGANRLRVATVLVQ